MGDLTGLDVSWRVRKRQAAARPAGLRYSPIADRLCEKKAASANSERGMVPVRARRSHARSEETDALIRSVSANRGSPAQEISGRAEMKDRCLHHWSTRARILEGLVARARATASVIWVHGYGFPRHRGGPMRWAGEVGLAAVAATVERLHAEQGDLRQARPRCFSSSPARDGRSSPLRLTAGDRAQEVNPS